LSEAVIAAIIAGLFALTGTVVSQVIISRRQMTTVINQIKSASDEKDAELRQEIAVIKTELSNLRADVQKHNSVIERTYHLETEVARQGEQIKTLFNK